MASRKAVLGIVASHQRAGDIIAFLRLNGFPMSLLSVVFGNGDSSDLGDDARSAAAARARFGGAVGFFANVASFTVPGLGPVVACGAIVPALRADAGGLPGCLSSLGISLLEAGQCERDLRAEHILLAVHVEHPAACRFVREVLVRHGAATARGVQVATLPYQAAA